MVYRVISSLLLSLFLGFSGEAAYAHPHVFIIAKTVVVYSAEGQIEGLKYSWTFDKMFSSYAIQGLGEPGKPKREDLQALAKENAEGLVEFEYFTSMKINGTKQAFVAPRDYYMEFKDGELTLFFFLPLKEAVPAAKSNLWFEVYDPSYFIAFNMALGNDAVMTTQAPQGCGVTLMRAKHLDPEQSEQYSEDFFENLPEDSAFTQQFANRAIVACP